MREPKFNCTLSFLVMTLLTFALPSLGQAAQFDLERANKILGTSPLDPLSTLEISFAQFIAQPSGIQKQMVTQHYRSLVKAFFADKYRATEHFETANSVLRKVNLAKEEIDNKLDQPESLDPNPNIGSGFSSTTSSTRRPHNRARQQSANPEPEVKTYTLSDITEEIVEDLLKARRNSIRQPDMQVLFRFAELSVHLHQTREEYPDLVWAEVVKALRVHYTEKPDPKMLDGSNPAPMLMLAQVIQQIQIIGPEVRLYMAKETMALSKAFLTGIDRGTALMQLETALAPTLERGLGADWNSKIETIERPATRKAEPQKHEAWLCKMKLVGRDLYDEALFWIRYRLRR